MKLKSSSAMFVLGGFWVLLFVVIWSTGAASFIPSPSQTIAAFPRLWNEMGMGTVEGRYKFEGGVGALMEINSKQFDYPAVFCTLFVILMAGLFQDYLIGFFKKLVCPYASIGLEIAQ